MDERLKKFIDTNTYRHNETGEYVKYGADYEENNKKQGVVLTVFNETNVRIISKEEFERDYTKVDLESEL